MAIATRTLKDTALETGSGTQGGKVTILVNMDDNTTVNRTYLTQVVYQVMLMVQN